MALVIVILVHTVHSICIHTEFTKYLDICVVNSCCILTAYLIPLYMGHTFICAHSIPSTCMHIQHK